MNLKIIKHEGKIIKKDVQLTTIDFKLEKNQKQLFFYLKIKKDIKIKLKKCWSNSKLHSFIKFI